MPQTLRGQALDGSNEGLIHADDRTWWGDVKEEVQAAASEEAPEQEEEEEDERRKVAKKETTRTQRAGARDQLVKGELDD